MFSFINWFQYIFSKPLQQFNLSPHTDSTRNHTLNHKQKLKLFSASRQNLEFHGVMRFYFEEHVKGNVATKCLRVCSNSSTQEIIETLSEKFRPDMKMLTTCYSLYEVHAKTGK